MLAPQKIKKLLHKGTLLAAFSLAVAGCTTTNQGTDELKPLQKANVTASTSNPDEMKKKVPTIWQDLSLMAKLPLTGKPVYDAVTNPGNRITSGLFYTDWYAPSVSHYLNRMVSIADNSGTGTAFHEYFHARQDVGEKFSQVDALTQKDALVCHLMEEAAATAYELAAQREAKNLKLRFKDSRLITSSQQIRTLESSSQRLTNIEAFNRGYNQAWEKNAGMDPAAREAAAIAAGGKEVVRNLLSGRDARWCEVYRAQAMESIRLNIHLFRNDALKTGEKYEARRAEMYTAMGYVSPQINLIPDEYLGPGAAASIDRCINAVGLRLITAPVSVQQTAPSL